MLGIPFYIAFLLAFIIGAIGIYLALVKIELI